MAPPNPRCDKMRAIHPIQCGDIDHCGKKNQGLAENPEIVSGRPVREVGGELATTAIDN